MNKYYTVVDDPNPQDPREWDNLGTMICFHNRYNLGDCKLAAAKKLAQDKGFTFSTSDLTDPHAFRQFITTHAKPGGPIAIFLGLWLYDHSGITMATSKQRAGRYWQHAQFDSGLVGYIFITRQQIRREYSVKRITQKLLAKVTEYLEHEVAAYDKFLRGESYGYQVFNEYGEQVESCYGYEDAATAKLAAEQDYTDPGAQFVENPKDLADIVRDDLKKLVESLKAATVAA